MLLSTMTHKLMVWVCLVSRFLFIAPQSVRWAYPSACLVSCCQTGRLVLTQAGVFNQTGRLVLIQVFVFIQMGRYVLTHMFVLSQTHRRVLTHVIVSSQTCRYVHTYVFVLSHSRRGELSQAFDSVKQQDECLSG